MPAGVTRRRGRRATALLLATAALAAELAVAAGTAPPAEAQIVTEEHTTGVAMVGLALSDEVLAEVNADPNGRQTCVVQPYFIWDEIPLAEKYDVYFLPDDPDRVDTLFGTVSRDREGVWRKHPVNFFAGDLRDSLAEWPPDGTLVMPSGTLDYNPNVQDPSACDDALQATFDNFAQNEAVGTYTARTFLSVPTAWCEVEPDPNDPATFHFDASKSSTTHDVLWFFGDNTAATGTTSTHTYGWPNRFSPTVRVTDGEGKTDTHVCPIADAVAPELQVGLSLPGRGEVAPGITDMGFGVGETATVRLHLAVTNGVGAVDDITFAGDPVTVAPTGAMTITGPDPPIPDDLVLEPGQEIAYDVQVEAVQPGPFTLSSTVQGRTVNNAVVGPVTAERNGRIGEIEVEVTADPESVQLEEGEDEEGPEPAPVTVTVEVTNPLDDPLEDATLTALEPQLLTQVTPPPGYQAFTYLTDPDPPGGPLEPGDPPELDLGTIPAGESVTREVPGRALDRGDVRLGFLVSGAVPVEGGPPRTVTGSGSDELSIRTDVVLELDAEIDPASHWVQGGQPWVDGGDGWRIDGTLENRTPDETVEVVVLPMLEGNASYAVPVPGDSAPSDEECGIGMVRQLGPGEEIDFEAPVRTLLDGGTRGTVRYAPVAYLVEEDGSRTELGPEEVLVTEGSGEHVVHVDTRDRPPTPPGPGELAWVYAQSTADTFADMVGSMAMMGIQATAFGLQPWLWEPAYRAAGDKIAEYVHTTYENLSPADQSAWEDNVVAAVALSTGMALTDARDLVDQQVVSSFTELSTAWETGDSRTVAEWWGRQTGAAPDLALGALARAYGVCKLIARSTPWARRAALAREADVAAELAALGDNATARNVPTGAAISREHRRRIWGIDDRMHRVVQRFVDEYGIVIGVRRRGPGALAKIEAGTHTPKPFHVKGKNVSPDDVQYLEAIDDVDTTMIYEPPPRSEVEAALDAANADADTRARVLALHETRMDEWFGKVDPSTGVRDFTTSERFKWAVFANEGLPVPASGQPLDYRTNVANGRSLPPDDQLYDLVDARIRTETTPGGRPAMILEANRDGAMKPFTGDMDPMFVANADLRLLPEAKRIEFYRRAHELGFEHVETASWTDPAGRNGYLNGHSIDGGEAMFTWMPNQPPRATRFDPRHSWFRPDDTTLTAGVLYLRGVNVEVATADPVVGDFDASDPSDAGAGTLNPKTIFLVDPDCPSGAEAAQACQVLFDRGPDALVLRRLDDGTFERWTEEGGWQPVEVSTDTGLTYLPQTVTTTGAQAGQGSLDVALPDDLRLEPGLDQWFAIGDLVVIDPGGPDEEYAVIGGFGSLVFTEPLEHDHPPGTLVSLVEGADPPTFPNFDFRDVRPNAWFADGLKWATAHEIVTGYQNRTYRGGNPLNRAQIVRMLWRLMDEPGGSPHHSFRDVPRNRWFVEALDWAAAEGLVTGYANGTYRPSNAVNRAQIVRMLWNLAGRPGGSPAHGFGDVSPSAWFSDALDWARHQGLVRGFADNTYRPDQPVNRAQIVSMLHALAGNTLAWLEHEGPPPGTVWF